MFSFLGLSARKPAPQPPPEPTSELGPDPPATTIAAPTSRKRKADDAALSDDDESSTPRRPAQTRRLVADLQLSPPNPLANGSSPSGPSTAKRLKAQSTVPSPIQSSPAVLFPLPKPTRWRKRKVSSASYSKGGCTSEVKNEQSPSRPEARPSPSSDSEGDSFATQSDTEASAQVLSHKRRSDIGLESHPNTNDHNVDSPEHTSKQHGASSKGSSSYRQACERERVVFDANLSGPEQEAPTDGESDEENKEDDEDDDGEEHANSAACEDTPAMQRTGIASEAATLDSAQKTMGGNENEQDEQSEDGEGRVAIIKSKSDPAAVPIILHEDVTDRKYTIGSIVDHRRDAEIDHAFELSVRWVGFAEPTWEPERSIQAQVPELLYKYWDGVGGRPFTGAFRVFSVLRRVIARPPKRGAPGARYKKRIKYLVQWEGYSADPKHTSVETEEKLRDIAPDELELFLEHNSAR